MIKVIFYSAFLLMHSGNGPALLASDTDKCQSAKIESIDSALDLPDGANKIENYARFYKISSLKSVDREQDILYIEARFISDGFPTGIYILENSQEFPLEFKTDQGCSRILAYFDYETGRTIYMECSPQR